MIQGNAVHQRDLAEAAGVSVMTVSRALRQAKGVSVHTCERIRQLAQDLGYRPNPMLSALMTTRRIKHAVLPDLCLGYLTPFSSRQEAVRTAFGREFYWGAQENAAQHGFHLEEFSLNEPDLTHTRLSQILRARGITGLVIGPMAKSQAHLRLDWSNLSAVAIGYSLVAPALHRVANHQYRSMRIAMRQLRHRGYRRIGLVLPQAWNERVDRQWLGSYLAEQTLDPKLKSISPLLLQDKDLDIKLFRRWLHTQQPDVVITNQARVYRWLDELGWRVPEDIGFLHLDCPVPNRFYSGIDQNYRAIGRLAIELLVTLLGRNERGVPTQPMLALIEGTWIEGNTIRAKLSESRVSN